MWEALVWVWMSGLAIRHFPAPQCRRPGSRCSIAKGRSSAAGVPEVEEAEHIERVDVAVGVAVGRHVASGPCVEEGEDIERVDAAVFVAAVDPGRPANRIERAPEPEPDRVLTAGGARGKCRRGLPLRERRDGKRGDGVGDIGRDRVLKVSAIETSGFGSLSKVERKADTTRLGKRAVRIEKPLYPGLDCFSGRFDREGISGTGSAGEVVPLPAVLAQQVAGRLDMLVGKEDIGRAVVAL